MNNPPIKLPWSLLCKMAVHALCNNMTLDQVLQRAIQQQLAREKQ